MEGKYLFCQDGNAPCSRDFKRVGHLANSGLVIYVHKRKDSLQCSTERRCRSDETYILHNVSRNDLKQAEYVGELSKYRTKCFQCKGVVQRVRSLLDELTLIRESQVIGICEHCKCSKTTKKCPRCEYILKKFLADKVSQCEERQRRFKVWLCRVKHLLQAILEGGNVCPHIIHQDPHSDVELKHLLQQLKVPLAVHEPLSEFFSIEKDLASLQNLTESKDIIDELILKLERPQFSKHYSSYASLYPSQSKMCICKYFMDRNFVDGPLPKLDFGYEAEKGGGKDEIGSIYPWLTGKTSPGEQLTDKESGKTGSTGHRTHRLSGKMSPYDKQKEKESDKPISGSHRLSGKSSAYARHKDGQRSKLGSAGHQLKGKASAHHGKRKGDEKNKAQSLDDKTPKTSSKNTETNKDQKSASDEDLTILKSLKDRRTSRKDGGSKHKSTDMTEEEKIFFKLLQDFKMQKHDKQVGTQHKHEKERRPTQLADLPSIKRKSHKSLRNLVSASESFMECDHIVEPLEMIKGTKIVPYDSCYKEEKKCSKAPLLFDMYSPDFACPDPEPPVPYYKSMADLNAVRRTKSSRVFKTKGAFSYALSDRQFIENGITKLPTEKIMRKMNIYKMEPTYPSWFDRNRSSTKYYSTEEILAEVNEDGSGKWFYKNGVVALDYLNSEDPAVGQRYVVYSTGTDCLTGRQRPKTVLASFDLLGNGVVYDHNGNIRLKYNQSEGLVVDGKIAPPGKWKWHTLNEPPVLQRLFINTNLKNRDPILATFHQLQQQDSAETKTAESKQEQEALMLTIELENYVKEKASKLLQKFQPFQIRMKAIKLNDYISLKILDQANIRLFLRDGATSLKLNIGMRLISNEIIDTETAEMSEVATPYDKVPPRTKSVANIQGIIDSVRNERKQDYVDHYRIH